MSHYGEGACENRDSDKLTCRGTSIWATENNDGQIPAATTKHLLLNLFYTKLVIQSSDAKVLLG
jgi:hypothetical protein